MGGVHSEDLAGHLRKVYPNKSGSLDSFTFVMWYSDEEVSLYYVEESERLVGWGCKASLMDLQREIFLKIHSLNREQDQERLSLKEDSCLQPLRQEMSPTENIHQ